jgi:hypothetical protein
MGKEEKKSVAVEWMQAGEKSLFKRNDVIPINTRRHNYKEASSM